VRGGFWRWILWWISEGGAEEVDFVVDFGRYLRKMQNAELSLKTPKY